MAKCGGRIHQLWQSLKIVKPSYSNLTLTMNQNADAWTPAPQPAPANSADMNSADITANMSEKEEVRIKPSNTLPQPYETNRARWLFCWLAPALERNLSKKNTALNHPVNINDGVK